MVHDATGNELLEAYLFILITFMLAFPSVSFHPQLGRRKSRPYASHCKKRKALRGRGNPLRLPFSPVSDIHLVATSQS